MPCEKDICNGVSCSQSIRVSSHPRVGPDWPFGCLSGHASASSKESKETEAAQMVDQGMAGPRAEASVRSV
ncbi:hypothetical protein DPMN_148230 [Dreissena polymorpha]|uniref:Uncharacterized protein n=1 Tax=Dreissena polymorpha TaxID=45954 RepID=A0A9D4FAD8_DREPO|nr:hypothetical protein DPMN_148189 [Dreissena polymorpha]KAH3794692.1 hypothetical protein DPMN_148230 [Dreissena polymorpha]